jgi:chromate reductase
MENHKIAVVVGSLREGSYNRKVARSICAMKDVGLDCHMVEIGDLPLYNQDYDSAPEQPPEYVRFRDEIRAAEGILFVSPEYNRGMPGVLKNAIDVASRPWGKSVWNQKPAGIITVSIGAIGGFGSNHQIRQACTFLNMPDMQHPEAYLGNISDDDFGEDGLLKDGKTREFVASIANAFADWVKLVHDAQGLLAKR